MIKFVDLFAGIGGIRLGVTEALDSLGIQSNCVLSSEIDRKAKETYELNFQETPSGDIHEINDIEPFDLLLAGFPCQPFSYAGKRNGFGDTRGTLFFEVERLLEKYSPKAFLLENVRGLYTHDQGRTFATIISKLEALDYSVAHLLLKVINNLLKRTKHSIIDYFFMPNISNGSHQRLTLLRRECKAEGRSYSE